MKQLTSRALLLSLVAILFAATTADSFAQLTKIWDLSMYNFALERLCRPGKLAVVSLGAHQRLIDITNGEILYTSTNTIFTNYWGDRFYVHESGNLNEYDVKTKEFVKVAIGIPQTSDSAMLSFDYTYHSIIIRNANTRELLDSFKIPGTPDVPTYGTSSWFVFSNDGRYLAFHFQKTDQPKQNNFLLYDRNTRELIIQKALPVNSYLIYQFFNTSNLMAYAEEVQLEGDDKKYSYIRIFDPDKREVVKNLKLTEIGIKWLLLKNDDSFLLFSETGSNFTKFFNFEKQAISDFEITTIMGPMYIDDSLYVTSSMRGYTFDWTVGVGEKPDTNPVIYPNPTTNFIMLNVDAKYFGGNWQLTNLNGAVVLHGLILPNPDLQINLSHLPSQIYYLRLQKDNFTVTYQVVKL